MSLIKAVTLFSLIALTWQTQAAVLPQDRSDAMYHSYQGGGMSIDGPSILLRKKIGNSVSVSANYYVDTISGASIDVLATASPYEEERTEKSVGVDLLHEKTLVSFNYTNSLENDFFAESYHLGVSQDFFGDLTTLTLGFSKGSDEICRIGDVSFYEKAERQNYRLGLTQIITKNMIVGLSFENIADQGYLNNPYRSVRYIDPTAAKGYQFETEVYPNTRRSNAAAVTANYYLPYRASVYAEAKLFSDSWGIDANTYKLGYIHTFGNDWIVELRARHYAQEKADFYQDLFSRSAEFNVRARDKEMSTFNNVSFGASVTYEFQFSAANFFKKSTINLDIDHVNYDYDNFRNVLLDAPVGEEPLYQYSANITRLYVSIFY
ncbi:DUF3570 domain-containing protein [Paraglaciecola sp.]|uniref:DUF3570 domain-containing protein n=1 Tax=Paraglaciecola sp. TaxID=1920173 RepID=UPI0032678F4A